MTPWSQASTYKRWKKDVASHRLSKKNKRANSSVDMCAESTFCKGNKAIGRSLMPQIYDVGEFRNEILKQYGVKSHMTRVLAANLKPSQDEIRKTSVDGIRKAVREGKYIDNPIVIAKDNYIIDGHHRWAALKAEGMKIKALRINDTADNVLGMAAAIGSEREVFG